MADEHRVLYLTEDDEAELRSLFTSDFEKRTGLAQKAIMAVRDKQTKVKVEHPLVSYGAMGLLEYVKSGDPKDVRDADLRAALKEMIPN